MEAQRYPDDYDGIVAGAPANYWIGLMTGELWSGLATTRDPAQDLPRAKLPALGAAVMAACDALDGLEDGLIDDPRACDFDPGILLCDNGDQPGCLTAGEVAAARAIYAGPTRPGTGERIFPGYALGSEHFEAPDGLGGWARYWSGVEKPGGSAIDFMRYSVFQDPDYDLRGFDFDADWDLANNRVIGADETLASALNAVDPDLTAFKAAGGRLISYHGWADALIPGQYAVDYYRQRHRGHGRSGRDDRLLPPLHGARRRALPRGAGARSLRRRGCPRTLGRGGRRARPARRVQGGRRSRAAHAAALPLPAGGALPGLRQHR